MIETREGNALAVKSGIIVHGCNCQGVMGSGIALQVRKLYPAAYAAYLFEHQHNGLKLGGISFIVIDDADAIPLKIIVNANTQDEFGTHRRQVNYEAVARCFENIRDSIAQDVFTYHHRKLDIVFPMIGAGLGGGNWKIIETIIDETIPDNLGFKKILYVYKP